ncbi:MAG: hypothetical protein KDD63_08020 [Bacteroidetes bacterium]|nr:hypothetical protein [Bacteroidota bacterium]MCB0852150.1 hypothetical protein [Bacteroidota bacterium]
MEFQTQTIHPGDFEPADHWYPKALNAQIHPLVAFFMNLSKEKILKRYCHLNPQVKKNGLLEILSYKPKHFLHAGADLFHVTNASGVRNMVIIETNSSPSGQKSMPLIDENQEMGGYYMYMKRVFHPFVKSKRGKLKGELAVLYDKNPMEASGYAGAMAEVFGEKVHFVPFFDHDTDPPARFNDGVLEIRNEANDWVPIRACFRYVTQKPWNRIPIATKTIILNPIISCLAGGRNKMMAAKAYDLYNADLREVGLKIHTPETIWDVRKNEIMLWVKRLGGHAVIKVPYSNAGQGVFTIVNEKELANFLDKDFDYDMFIVQSLIGNYSWSSVSEAGKLFHVGTMPNKRNETYVADIRMMIGSMEDGLRPMAIYARRARSPLVEKLESANDSWEILGTNLSINNFDGTFTSDSSRLMMMDRRDFNKLGISLDDLIEGYIQTILSLIAIDKMAVTLINQKGKMRNRLFSSLNNDLSLIKEILPE